MVSDWMGKYRDLIRAITRHSNVVSCANMTKTDFGNGIMMTPISWQTLEFIVENNESTLKMVDIARKLGIAQSSFSKVVKDLVEKGFVEKYMSTNNKKNIILRPTEKGTDFYFKYNAGTNVSFFDSFFEEIKDISDEDIVRFTRALNALTESLPPYEADNTADIVKI